MRRYYRQRRHPTRSLSPDSHRAPPQGRCRAIVVSPVVLPRRAAIITKLWAERAANASNYGPPLPDLHFFRIRVRLDLVLEQASKAAFPLKPRGPGDLLLEGDQVRAAQRYGFWLQRLVRQIGIA